MPNRQRLQLAQIEICDNIERVAAAQLKRNIAAVALYQVHMAGAAPLTFDHCKHPRARACVFDATSLDGELVKGGTVNLRDGSQGLPCNDASVVAAGADNEE